MNSTLSQASLGVGGFMGMAVVAVGLIIWERRRCRGILTQWAAENGYRLVQSEERYLRRGPFFWTTSRGQSVFLVTVREGDGRIRQAWLRVGHWLLGIFSRQVAVKWVD